MKLTDESKFFVGILLGTVVIISTAMWAFSRPAKPIVFPRETLISASAHQIGNPRAQTYLVEFSDFQCPACAAFEPAVESLVQKYPDTLLFAYRHFPLPQHTQGKSAAIAAEAAALQGKFWEMHHELFANQTDLAAELYPKLAEKLSLNVTLFLKDIQDSTVAAKVDADAAGGSAIGIQSTPTFFLNGTKLELFEPGDLTKAVETALSSK